ncbi:MAG TPA: hypothetical protein VII70_06185 [Steroidobacteraceae bacterium]
MLALLIGQRITGISMGRVAAIVTLAALMMVPNPLTPAATADYKSFPLTLARGSRLMIAARINGYPVTARLDSAAEATSIDRSRSEELKLNQGQAVTGEGSRQCRV